MQEIEKTRLIHSTYAIHRALIMQPEESKIGGTIKFPVNETSKIERFFV